MSGINNLEFQLILKRRNERGVFIIIYIFNQQCIMAHWVIGMGVTYTDDAIYIYVWQLYSQDIFVPQKSFLNCGSGFYQMISLLDQTLTECDI